MSDERNDLPALPNGWAWTTVGDICTRITKGSTPTSYGYSFKKEGINFVKTENINENGVINNLADFIDEATNEFLKRSILQANDILFSIAGTIGRVGIVKEKDLPANTNQALAIVRGLWDFVDAAYVFYFLKSRFIQREALKSVVGVGRANVSLTNLGEFDLPLPPLSEQRRIVAKIEALFTQLDEGVAALKRAQAQLKLYRQSVVKAAVEGELTEEWREAHQDELEPASVLLERILKERQEKWEAEQSAEMEAKGKLPKDDKWKAKYKEPATPDTKDLTELPEEWEWVSGDVVFWFITSGSRGWAKYYSESGALFLRMGNLDHDSIRLDLENIQRVKPPLGTEGARTRVIEGDILISITADVGMIALAPPDIEEAYINQHVALSRAVPSINRSYLAWFLAVQEAGQKQFLKLQRGATKMGLGLDDIRAISVPLPPLEEQKKIVDEIDLYLSLVDEVEATIEAELKRADRLHRSILKDAFSGKLVPQDPNDEPAGVLLERIKDEKSKRELEQRRHKPRRKTVENAQKDTEKERQVIDLHEILLSSKQSLTPKALWQSSRFADDIEAFYTQLKKEVEAGRIIERRPNEADIYLGVVK